MCKPNAEASLLDYAEAKPKIAQNLKNFAAIAQLVEHNLAPRNKKGQPNLGKEF